MIAIPVPQKACSIGVLGAFIMNLATTMTIRTEERWNFVFEQLGKAGFCFILSPEGRYLATKVPDESRMPMSLKEYPGKLIEDMLPEELAAPRRFFFDRAVQTKTAQTYIYPHPQATEEDFKKCSIVPLLNEDSQELTEVLMIVRDVFVAETPEHHVLSRVKAQNN